MSNQAIKDANSVATLIGVSSVDLISTVTVAVDPVTHRVLTNAVISGITSINGDTTAAQIIAAGTGISVSTSGGTTTITNTASGTVTSVSVVSANGFTGTVATATTTPAITLTTSISSAVLAGNGTALIAATTTGSGSTVVLSTSPSLVTPSLGVASATTINKVALTAPATGSTLTIADGKTLTASDSTALATNTITMGGGEVITFSASNALSLLTSGSTVMTFPAATDTVVTLAATQTISNKRVKLRVVTTTQSATPTINTDNTDVAAITGLAQAVTSFTTNLSGTPNAGDLLMIQITDNGTARGLTFGASFEATTVALPTTTVISTLLRIGFQWNPATSKWSCIAVA